MLIIRDNLRNKSKSQEKVSGDWGRMEKQGRRWLLKAMSLYYVVFSLIKEG